MLTIPRCVLWRREMRKDADRHPFYMVIINALFPCHLQRHVQKVEMI